MNRMFIAKLGLLADRRWNLGLLFRSKTDTKPSCTILLILSDFLFSVLSFDLNAG